MKMSLKTTLLLVVIGVFSVLPAQKKIKVKKAVGTQVVEADLTPNQAEAIALREAKSDAMRKAGIPEKVWSVLGQITDSKNDELIEAYSEMSTITLNGLVTVEEKSVTSTWDPVMKQQIKRVEISALVQQEVESDNEFVVDIKGFKPLYKEGEQLEFDVKVYNRNAYIKVFWFDSKEGALIFPLLSSEDVLFDANSVQEFPKGDFKYTISKSDVKSEHEEVNIMIVATKENIPFVGDVNFQSVIKWIYEIPANNRVSKCSRFVIM